MSEASHHDSQKLREELVAYLDGELDTKGVRRIEQRLADDPEARRVLQEMDRTWQLLDSLSPAGVDEEFTRTTLEMVAIAATEDAQQQNRLGWRRAWMRGLLAMVGLAVAAAAGFFGVGLFTPDPDAALLRDLPVIENLDEYRQIDDVDFLRLLVREKLFTEDTDDAP